MLRRLMVALLFAAVAPMVAAQAQDVAAAGLRFAGSPVDSCPEGVPSAVSPNYVTEGPDAPTGPYCIEFQIRSDGPSSAGGYLPATSAPELCGIQTYGRVIRLLKVISQCGVVLYGMGGWESPGVLMGGPGGVAIKAEVFRLGTTLARNDPQRHARLARAQAHAEKLREAQERQRRVE